MVPLGTSMPLFVLSAVNGDLVESAALTGEPALVMFLCNHCPYVRHIEARLGEVLHEFANLLAVGICSNDAVGYPDDALERLAGQALRADWRFPYLVDTGQEVARSFRAAHPRLLPLRRGRPAGLPRRLRRLDAGQPHTGDRRSTLCGDSASVGSRARARATPAQHGVLHQVARVTWSHRGPTIRRPSATR
jgi:peroxiredoxin